MQWGTQKNITVGLPSSGRYCARTSSLKLQMITTEAEGASREQERLLPRPIDIAAGQGASWGGFIAHGGRGTRNNTFPWASS